MAWKKGDGRFPTGAARGAACPHTGVGGRLHRTEAVTAILVATVGLEATTVNVADPGGETRVADCNLIEYIRVVQFFQFFGESHMREGAHLLNIS